MYPLLAGVGVIVATTMMTPANCHTCSSTQTDNSVSKSRWSYTLWIRSKTSDYNSFRRVESSNYDKYYADKLVYYCLIEVF